MVTIKIDKPNHFSNDEQALFVSFKYDPDIVTILRGLSRRFYHAGEKIWEAPVTALNQLLNTLSNRYTVNVIGQVETKPEIDIKLPDTFEFITEPFQHQVIGVKYGLKNPRYLLADDMGLGKTKQIIDLAICRKIQDGVKHCLIICGVNGLKWNWKNEIATHSQEKCWILGQQYNRWGDLKVGSNADKLHDLISVQDYQYDQPFFLITNIESLRDTKITEQLETMCDTGIIGMIAVDEHHKASNPTSQQGKALLKLQAKFMVSMTGTPIMNNPIELYSPLKWLGYEKHNFYQFKNHFCKMGGYGNYQVVGYKNLHELKETTDKIMLRRRKEDVLDLPDKLYIDDYVEMGDAQRTIYNEVKEDLLQNIDMVKLAPNPLTALIRLRQATGFTGILSSTIRESAKLDRLEELVKDILDEGRKCIIFSNWMAITDEIMKRFKKHNPATITGKVGDYHRIQETKRFQENDDCKIIIGTTGAMGTGITLTAATTVIFVDEPWNYALYSQAVDRAHRIGQKNNLTIINLLTKGTIDEKIHQLIYKKKHISDVMIDNEYPQISPADLDFLLS